MKKYIKGVLFISLLLLTSCYTDKGNYNYSSEVMAVDSVEKTYIVNIGEKLEISPIVSPADNDYEYVWGIYKESVVSQGTPKLDTISTAKNLSWVCDVPASNYAFVFIVRNRKTNVAKTTSTTISVRTDNTIGWYILKDYEGVTDMDMFNPVGKIENFISLYNDGKNLKGRAVSICFSNMFPMGESEAYVNALLVTSNSDVVTIEINTGKIINGTDDIFYDKPEKMDIVNSFGANRAWYIFNDGNVHELSVAGHKISGPIPCKYTFCDKFVYKPINNAGIFFDDNLKTFLCFGDGFYRFEDEAYGKPGPMSPNKMNKDLIALVKIGEDAGGYSGYAYALMSSKEKNEQTGLMEDKKLVVEMDITGESYNNPILSFSYLPVKSQVWKADRWTGNVDDDVIIFHYNGKIYSFNPKTLDEKELLTLRPDEELTYMEHVIYKKRGETDEPINSFVIATVTPENEYRIYRHKFVAGTLSKEEPAMTGKGRVAKVLYTTQWTSSLQ